VFMCKVEITEIALIIHK